MSESTVTFNLTPAGIFLFGFCFGAGALAGVLTLVAIASYARRALAFAGTLF
jgi:dienelactone hydrolase